MSKECPRPNHENDRVRAHLGTTTGPRLCPKDQPQQVRMPKVAELSQNAWPRRAAAAGAPHTAAVRFLALLVVVSSAHRVIRGGPLFGRSDLVLCHSFGSGPLSFLRIWSFVTGHSDVVLDRSLLAAEPPL